MCALEDCGSSHDSQYSAYRHTISVLCPQRQQNLYSPLKSKIIDKQSLSNSFSIGWRVIRAYLRLSKDENQSKIVNKRSVVMKNSEILLLALLSITLIFSQILLSSVVGASATMPQPDDHSIIHSMVEGSRRALAIAMNVPQQKVVPMVAAGRHHTVGLKADGTVVAQGWNNLGQCNVGGWTGIVQVAAGWHHTVGLKADGTVVAQGCNDLGQLNIGSWRDIAQVAAG